MHSHVYIGTHAYQCVLISCTPAFKYAGVHCFILRPGLLVFISHTFAGSLPSLFFCGPNLMSTAQGAGLVNIWYKIKIRSFFAVAASW